MESVFFRNGGVLDINAAFISGVNSKQTDSPIGYFGTGLKFAIATLLRQGHEITIWCGLEKHEVHTCKRTISSKEFDLVMIGDRATDYTTQLGRDWETWMAFRELYSNAKDEGEWLMGEGECSINPDAGSTIIEVKGDPIHNVYLNRNDYIIDSDETFLTSCNGVEIYAQDSPSPALFYQGIRAGNTISSHETLFRYNITKKTDLTEDRTFKNPYLIEQWIEKAVCNSTHEILKTVMTAPWRARESSFTYPIIDLEKDSLVEQVLKDLMNDSSVDVNGLSSSVLSAIKQLRDKDYLPKEYEFEDPTEPQQKKITKALDFLVSSGLLSEHISVKVEKVQLPKRNMKFLAVPRDNFTLDQKEFTRRLAKIIIIKLNSDAITDIFMERTQSCTQK